MAKWMKHKENWYESFQCFGLSKTLFYWDHLINGCICKAATPRLGQIFTAAITTEEKKTLIEQTNTALQCLKQVGEGGLATSVSQRGWLFDKLMGFILLSGWSRGLSVHFCWPPEPLQATIHTNVCAKWLDTLIQLDLYEHVYIGTQTINKWFRSKNQHGNICNHK